MKKPEKTFVAGIDLSDWLKKYPFDFKIIGVNLHSCKHCSNVKITFLGVGLMLGFANDEMLRKKRLNN